MIVSAERHFLFGDAWLNVANPDSMLRLLEEARAERRQVRIGHHNLHSLYLFCRELEMRRFYTRCDFCYLDGWGATAAGKLSGAGDLSRFQRMTFLDWWQRFFGWAQEREYQILCYGGTKASAALSAARLRETFPRLKVEAVDGFTEFTQSPFSQNCRCILLVGLGMPLQEKWVERNANSNNFDVVITVGGFFDYLSGTQKLPPRWLGRWKLEWLFRLCSNPRRLAGRYLWEPWVVVFMALRLRFSNSAMAFGGARQTTPG